MPVDRVYALIRKLLSDYNSVLIFQEVAIVSNAAIHDPSSEANPNLHVIQHVDFDLKIDFDTKTVSGNVKIMIEQIDTSTEKQEPLVRICLFT